MERRKRRIFLAIAIACTLTVGCRSTANVGSKNWKPESASSSSTPSDNQHKVATEVVPVNQVTLASYMPSTVEVATEISDAIDNTKRASNSSGLASAKDAQSIDLATALMLTTGQNPKIMFAKARIEESVAQLERANSLKLPSIRAGVNYNKHEGRIQDVAGNIIETSRGSFYHGFGANAVGASSPAVPGLVSQFHLADALFLPSIAQRTNCARRSESQATINDSLLATSLAYIELLRAKQELAVAEEILEQAKQLERTTAEFMRVGSGLASDHDRARTELALRENEVLRAEETTLVNSAKLAQLIRWDTSDVLDPAESQLVPISMVDKQMPQQELVAIALSSRPELSEAKHLVGAAVERLRRERNAPLVPSVILAASYGGLAGGLGSTLGNYGDRIDLDAGAYWEVRQLGAGERAVQREAQSRISQAKAIEIQQMDRIAREVVEGCVQSELRFRQVAIAERAIEAANESYRRNLDRIKNGQGLPIEVLQAIQALSTARREYIRVVTDYNVAQFSLHRALGWPIH